MNGDHSSTSRRSFLKTALAVPLAISVGSALHAENTSSSSAETSGGASAANSSPLPMRTLGRDGAKVTMLTLGGMMSALSPEYLDIAWSMGIRYLDTADCYLHGNSEKIIGQWLAKYPERRKEVFIVTKDHPHKGPEQLLEMIDRRLAALGTNYVDCFYIHQLSPKEYGPESLEWPKSDRFKKVIEQLKSAGKCRKVGFSCHDDRLPEYLTAAAEGGFVDQIMLKYTPFFTPGDALDTALTAAHKAGIGLVAMKTMRTARDVPKRLPEFDKLGLTTQQAVLHATWSDPRISAICSNIENVSQMDANTSAARSYKQPLKTAHIELLRQITMEHRRTMCPGCPGCQESSKRTQFAFNDISRFVTYYEQDGHIDAKKMYLDLPLTARDHSSVDLAALRDSCAFKTDYPEIVRRAQRYFASA